MWWTGYTRKEKNESVSLGNDEEDREKERNWRKGRVYVWCVSGVGRKGEVRNGPWEERLLLEESYAL
jgi:hypothetical protein